MCPGYCEASQRRVVESGPEMVAYPLLEVPLKSAILYLTYPLE